MKNALTCGTSLGHRVLHSEKDPKYKANTPIVWLLEEWRHCMCQSWGGGQAVFTEINKSELL